MVLFDNVVEVFDFANQNRRSATIVDRIDRRLVGAALVHRDFVWIAARSHGLIEEALRCSHVSLRRQSESDGLALLVDGAVKVFKTPLNFT